MRKPFPIVSTSLAGATLIASSTIAMVARGRPWSSVPILQLLHYGAVDNSQLASGEWWLLLSAQFVHVKQMHMVFNVAALFLLGFAVERVTGPFRFGVLWLLSGGVGTFASIYSVAPPYDIGSGASQALMGIAAAAIIVIWRNHDRSRWLVGTLSVTLVSQLALDLVSAHYPMPGHVFGFLVGLILATGLVPKGFSVSA